MINIIEKSMDFTAVEIYKMTKASNIVLIKELEDGTEIEVKGYIIFTDEKNDGTEVELLSIMSTDGTVYVTQSETFKNDFADIAALGIFPDVPIVKSSGVSKSDRKFLTCLIN